jgi:autotransporter-associated beta strand protein
MVFNARPFGRNIMTYDRKPLWLVSRIVSIAIIISFIPAAALTSAAQACMQLYWNGSNPTDTSFFWKDDPASKTNWDDNNLITPTMVHLDANDRLFFPERAVNKHATNDKDGLTPTDPYQVYDITFPDPGSSGYLLDGNPIQLTSGYGIVDKATTGTNTIDLDVTFPHGQTVPIEVDNATVLEIVRNVYSNGTGGKINKTGTGTLSLDFKENSTYTGMIQVTAGTLQIGKVVSGSLKLLTGTTLAAEITGPEDYSQIKVTGTVNLGAGVAALDLTALPEPTTDQTYTLIDNDGTDPVSGFFAGIPNSGETLIRGTGGQLFFLSYTGGDGNDVVLTPFWYTMYEPVEANQGEF